MTHPERETIGIPTPHKLRHRARGKETPVEHQQSLAKLRGRSILESCHGDMSYLVAGKVTLGKNEPLREVIDDGSLGEGSIAGSEYVRNMNQALPHSGAGL